MRLNNANSQGIDYMHYAGVSKDIVTFCVMLSCVVLFV